MRPLLRWGKWHTGLWVLCVVVLLVLIACTEEKIAGGSTSTQTGTKVVLSGRVVDKNNVGLAGLEVELSRAGLKDTTDSQGKYSLVGTVEDGADSGQGSVTVLDTLFVKQNGQDLVSLPVFHWVDTLPDIKIIQRDISGKILSAPVSIGRIEAVISGDGIPGDHPVVVPLFYFKLSGSYTGFAYFRGTNTLEEYAVFVRAFDTEGNLLGHSPVVQFNSMAGDIPIPEFDAGSALPKVFAGNDTVLEWGGRVSLRGSATPAFGGQITRLEWDAGGTGTFRQYPAEFTIDLPGDTGTYVWILRAWDNLGNSAVDTIVIRSVGPAICNVHEVKFFTDHQYCTNYWWEADQTGLPTTITFEIGDTSIVKFFGAPIGLPPGYGGPYPPAAQYVTILRPQGKKGTTQIRVFANRSDGSVGEYNSIWVTRE